ncbi:MAG TPA: glycosyltransferase family 2 protein [Anaerolineaceae bacterium]|nr:glycosyltransferase family 2 protein [Anaerolineaceae bacterium]
MLSVLIPAYNEEAVIGVTLDELAKSLTELKYEVIVVDDGSQDRTAEIVAAIARQKLNVFLIHNPENLGKGRTLLHAFEHSHGDLIVFLDADMEIHPSVIHSLLAGLEKQKVDVLVGSKHSRESNLTYPLHRRIASRAYRALTGFFLNIDVSDTQTGIKLFRREVLDKTFPKLTIARFAFDIELLVAIQRLGYRLGEVPVDVAFRREGWGRIDLRNTLRMGLDLVLIFYRTSFWKWLNPSLPVRLWMLLFVAGLTFLDFGVAHLLTQAQVRSPALEWIAYMVTLRFMDKTLRDWLFVLGGLVAISLALLKLNKSILAAFARAEARTRKEGDEELQVSETVSNPDRK